MNWNCPRCQNELGELNGCCEYCKLNNIIVYNPDKYFIRDIRIYHISQGGKIMTPQEELFADLFNGYRNKPTVQAMTDLELRAHREELSKIAFEARAYIYAVDDVLKERKPKSSQGFKGSVNTDETTTNAINTIKERQKKLSGKEKIREGLVALYSKGMTRLEAEKAADAAMGAGAILSRLKDEKSRDIITGKNEAPTHNDKDKSLLTEEPKKQMFNPFERK